MDDVAEHTASPACSVVLADTQTISRQGTHLVLASPGYNVVAVTADGSDVVDHADRHRAKTMQKLGIHTVSALVLFAVRCGLVDAHRASA